MSLGIIPAEIITEINPTLTTSGCRSCGVDPVLR